MVVLLCCLVLAALPAQAAAVTRHAPPGNSGIDEYVESVPDSGGNSPTDTIQKEGGAARLGKRAQRAFKSYGSEGQSVADLAGATTPDKPSRKRARRGGSEETGAADVSGSHPASALRRAVTGSDQGGMGLALPIILALTLLAAGYFALVGRGRAGRDGSEESA